MRVTKIGYVGLMALICVLGTWWVLAASQHSSLPAMPSMRQAEEVKTGLRGDPAIGKTKAEVCIACHGAEGNSAVPSWPKIAGQLEKYLVKELIEYQKAEKGARFDPTMAALTQALTQQDIIDLAAFFSRQTMTPGAAQPGFLELGQKLYRGGDLQKGIPACIACHGTRGEGNEPAQYPRLSGQHAEYTVDQLKKFRGKTRSGDPNAIMRDIANKMTDQEIQAVSSYVSGLH